MTKPTFTSNKPYLFRAIFEWLLDNDSTPYILVDTSKANVDVPSEFIKDEQIVLNVMPSAVQNWLADQEAISFSARFGGKARQIYVPMNALMAVYAQENGQGMAFPAEEDFEDEHLVGSDDVTAKVNQQAKPAITSDDNLSETKKTKLKPVTSNNKSQAAKSPKTGSKKASHLSVVK